MAVAHSVHWLARAGGRARDSEADFVLAHPRHGVLVLEVKGGRIRRDAATLAWTSEDLGGTLHPITYMQGGEQCPDTSSSPGAT